MSENYVVYDKPEKVEMAEWAFGHPNCDALIVDDDKAENGYMFIKAYALNEKGNDELRDLSNQDSNYGIFVGIDESMLSFIGAGYR